MKPSLSFFASLLALCAAPARAEAPASATAKPAAIPLWDWFLDKGEVQDESFRIEQSRGGHELAFSFTFASREAEAPAAHRSLVRALGDLPAYAPPEGREPVLRIEARGSIEGRHLRLRLVDANDEVRDTKPLTLAKGFTALEFPLETSIEASWGGDANGRIDWPLKLIRIDAVDWAHIYNGWEEIVVIRSVELTSRPKAR